jgi:predicted Zn-dependent protease
MNSMNVQRFPHGLAILAAVLALVAGGGWLPAQEAVTGEPAAPAAQDQATEGQMAALPENRQRAIDFLVKELQELSVAELSDNAEARTLFQDAAAALVDKDANAAREKLAPAAEKFPLLPPADLLVAAMLYAGGNPAAGQEFLEKAATAAPGNPLVYTSFARIALSQSRRTDARVLLEKATRVAGEGTWAEAQQQQFQHAVLDASADLALLEDDRVAARQALEPLLADERLSANAELRLAEVSFREEKLDESLQHLEKYVAKTPDALAPEILLAGLFQRVGKAEQVGEWVEKAYEKYPDKIPVLTEYAGWKVAQEKFDEANLALAKIEQLAGNMPRAMLLKGKIAFAQQSYELAESRFAELHRLEPENAEISNLWAMALAESSSADKLAMALETAQQNLQRQPQNAYAAVILGWVYFQQKNYEQANNWFSRAAQTPNLPPEAGYYFARFLQHLGKKEDAIRLLDTALSSTNLFLYRNAAIALKGELNASGGSLVTPDGR